MCPRGAGGSSYGKRQLTSALPILLPALVSMATLLRTSLLENSPGTRIFDGIPFIIRICRSPPKSD